MWPKKTQKVHLAETTRVRLDSQKCEKGKESNFIIYLDGKRKEISNLEFEFHKNENHWVDRLRGTKGIVEVDGSIIGGEIKESNLNLYLLQDLLQRYKIEVRSRENSIIITKLEDCIAREKSKTDLSICE